MTDTRYLIRAYSGAAEGLPPEIRDALQSVGAPPQSVEDHEARTLLDRGTPTVLRMILFGAAREGALDVLFAKETDLEQPPRWAFFDGDATLLAGETIDELARRAGVYDRVAAITARAMAGETKFEPALRERVAQLKGLDVEALDDVITAMPLSPGAEETVRALKAAGIRVAVLSGGFHFLLDRLKDQLALDFVAGNRLEMRDGKLTGELVGDIVDGERKAKLLQRVLRDDGVPSSASVAVGDGANDIFMLRAAGLGVAYQANPIVLRFCDGALYRGGLDGLLDLLKLR